VTTRMNARTKTASAISAVGAAFLLLLILASNALAWHGDVMCKKFHLVGTPVHLEWSQNGHVYTSQDVTGAWEQTVDVPTPPGYGPVTVVGTWKPSQSESTSTYTYTTSESCGTPPAPPTATPPPAPQPPATVPPAATPPAPAPPTTPVVNKPPRPKPKHVCPIIKKSDIHVSVTPKGIDHGKVHINVTSPRSVKKVKVTIKTVVKSKHYTHYMSWTLNGHNIIVTVYSGCTSRTVRIHYFNKDPQMPLSKLPVELQQQHS
jgi:hypothetical protein